jgi:hypothetical protein
MVLLNLFLYLSIVLLAARLVWLHFEQINRIEGKLDELTDVTMDMSLDIAFLLFVVEENLTDEQRERVGSRMCKCGDGCTCCDSKREDEKIGLTD